MKNIIRSFLSKQMRGMAMLICRFPYAFIVAPCIVTVLLGSGMAMLRYDRDSEKLIAHRYGKAINYKNIVESLFPRNTSEFADVARITETPPMIYVESTRGRNVFRLECLEDLELFDRMIKDIRINQNGNTLGYKDLCGMVGGHCYEDNVIRLLPDKENLANKRKRIKYPVDMNEVTYFYTEYSSAFGGVTVDENNFVEEIVAFRIFYLMDTSNASKIPAIEAWNRAVVEKIKSTNFSSIKVQPTSFSILSSELEEATDFFKPLAASVVAIVGVFSFFACMTSNMVTSKPWLGVASIVSAGLALLSSFGLLFYSGVPISDFHIAIPFLVLGTEVDDAYVLIATWRKTDPRESVANRMAETFAEAGVSITITSLTTVISCCIGLMAPFPIVIYFCIYGAVSLAFTYVYMITFFAACMALDGLREKKLLHAITFRKCSSPNEDSLGRRNLKIPNEIYTMKVFKDVIGRRLEKTPAKIIIVLLFIGNLSVGTWGLFQLEDGLDLRTVASTDSMTTKGWTVFYRHFNKYYSPLQITFNVTLDYSDPLIQNSIEKMLQKFMDHPNVANSHMLSWLKYYKMFQTLPLGKFFFRGYDFSKEEDFISSLRDVFLRIPPARQFKYDIKFNKNFTKIVASRFILALFNINSKQKEYEVLRGMWKIANESIFPTAVHAPPFPLVEQGVIIRDIVFQLTWVTSLLIFLVFFCFIPNLVIALIVSLSVACVLIETVGYAALSGLNLDIVTASSMIICIGFSINYPSHMAYAFTVAKGESSNDKMRESLYLVGLPILQGSLSTLLSCCPLLSRNIYTAVAFSKIVYFVVLHTTFHAMFFLPVMLSVVNKLPDCAKLKFCRSGEVEIS